MNVGVTDKNDREHYGSLKFYKKHFNLILRWRGGYFLDENWF